MVRVGIHLPSSQGNGVANKLVDKDPRKERAQGAAVAPSRPLTTSTTETDLRLHLCKLPGLLALGQVMAQSSDEFRLLRLAGSSISSLGPFQLLGIHITDRGWYEPVGLTGSDVVGVESQLRNLAVLGGPLSVPGRFWAWAFGMRCSEGQLGHLAVSADKKPTPSAHLLVEMLAQQTTFAWANVRLRRRASEPRKANTGLAISPSGIQESTPETNCARS